MKYDRYREPSENEEEEYIRRAEVQKMIRQQKIIEQLEAERD